MVPLSCGRQRHICPRIRRKKKGGSKRSRSKSYRKESNKHQVDIKQVNTSQENLTTETNKPSVHEELDNNKLIQSCTLEGFNPITAQLQTESPLVMNKDTIMHLKIKHTDSQVCRGNIYKYCTNVFLSDYY